MSSEAKTSNLIELYAPMLGYTLMRNNVGAAQDDTGRWIRFGLGNISSQRTKYITSVDWIGFRNRDGKFTAIEAKRLGWNGPYDDRERAQERFINLIKQNNGIAGFVTNLADLQRTLEL